MKNRNQDSGFSMIQTIISLGLISFISLAILKILKDQTRMSKNSSNDFEIIFLIDEIRSYLANPTYCTSSLKGHDSSFSNVESLENTGRYGKNNLAYQIFSKNNKYYGQNNLKILSMRLEAGEKEFHPSVNQTWLVLEIAKSSALGTEEVVRRRINLHVLSNQKGVIKSCYTLGGLGLGPRDWRHFQQSWKKVPLTKKVFYPGKKIVIGDKKGDGQLIIKGGLLLESNLVKKCSSGSEGTMRYNINENSLEGCYGKNWEVITRGKKRTPAVGQEYQLSNSKNQPVTQTTTLKYEYCELTKYSIDGGKCEAMALERSNRYSLWLLKASHYRGDKVECSFKCYRQ